jgi:hypothetical protein
MRSQLALVLALSASLSSHAGPQGGVAPLGTVFGSETVELERLCGSQVRTIQATHALGSSLDLGTRSFPVELSETPLLIIGAGKRAERVRDGKVLTLRWEAGGKPQERRLLFEVLTDAAWAYGPATAERFELAGEAFYLVDADLDGELGDLRADGWSATPGGPLMPLAREFVLGTRRVLLEGVTPEGRLEAQVRAVAGTPTQLATLRELNRLRNSVGLLGVDLAPALSEGCSEHARYLLASSWSGESQVHDQVPGSPGASRAGRLAAQHGYMVAAPGPEAVRTMWEDPSGRAVLLAPDLGRIGISDVFSGATVLDASSPETRRPDPTLRWEDVLLAPCDRGRIARGVKRPLLFARFSSSGELKEPRVRLLRVDGREPRELPLELLPEVGALHCTAARPERALKRGALYLVEHSALISGERRTASALFEVE